MDGTATDGCPHCRELEERVRALEAIVARLSKDSTTSSKPPSSDIVKPPRAKPAGGGKRTAGAQPGHPMHPRPPFPPDQVDQTVRHALTACPDCGGPVEPGEPPPRTLQQVEVRERPVAVTEHQRPSCYCPRCRRTHYAPLPAAVRRAGLVGPRLTALVAFLKGGCHCSFTTIRKFLRDVAGVTLSRGQLAKLVAKVSASLQAAYDELLALLPKEPRLNVDETGHKDRGRPHWTWCFRAALLTLFKIAPSRGHGVLLEVLGREFDGVLGCDYFGAYRKYMGVCGVLVQFCLAQLIRDIKFLAAHPDRRTAAYGRRLREAARQLFAVIHRRDALTPADFAGALEDAGNQLAGAATYRVPRTPEADNLARRFEQHGDSYLRFITTPGVEPTNNLAEQAIRFVVLDRRVTQGSRGETGQRWLERIWTAMATCAQQGRSVFQLLDESVRAHWAGEPTPSLAPNTS